jgi:hypothetical protein
MPKVVFNIKNIVKEHLPGYENVKEFMSLFKKYFVYALENEDEPSRHKDILIEFLEDNLSNEYKNDDTSRKKAQKFVKGYNSLIDSFNKLRNAKKPDLALKREKLKIKMIVLEPVRTALANITRSELLSRDYNYLVEKTSKMKPKVRDHILGEFKDFRDEVRAVWFRTNFNKIKKFFDAMK